MPGQSLQLPAHVNELSDPIVLFIGLSQLRILPQGLIQRHIQLCGHHLGDGVHKSVRKVHDAAHVPDHALGRQRSERDDLRDLVPPVLVRDIVDDFAPSLEAEVHVDIGHGDALRVQEPLEEKVIFDGIDVRDVQAVSDYASRRAPSSGADHDVVLPREIDVIPDDQEIVHVPHLADRVQLVLQSLPEGPVVVRVPLLHAVVAELVQVSPGVIAFRHLEVRELGDAELDLHVAAVRDLVRVVQRLLGIGKQGAHLRLALYEELPAGIAHPVLIGQLLARLNAQQNIVRLHVVGVRVVDVIRRDQRNPQAPAHGHERHVHLLLVLVSVVLQLQEEIALSEDIQIFEGRLVRGLQVIPDYVPGDLAGQTGAGRDDPLMELAQQLLVDSGLVIVPFREGAAHYFHQVGVALVVLRQKNQVVVAVVARPLLPVEPRSGRHVDLAADDGLDPGLFAGFIKIDHAVHDAVIGNRRAVHAEFPDALYIFFDLIGAVQQRIFRVDVQMCKCHTASLSAAHFFSFM